MKRVVFAILTSLALLLSGCATTVRSDVTTFNQWPAQLPEKTYAFDLGTDPTLELRSYEALVREEMGALGFRESANPAVKVSLHVKTRNVPVQLVEPVPFYGGFGRHYFGPPLRATEENRYHRELHLAIKSAKDGKRLFEATVRNVSRTVSTPAIMPALVHSAFESFPGPNGGTRDVVIERKG